MSPFKYSKTAKQSPQDLNKLFNTHEQLSKHIDQCADQDIRDNFFPTLIAVDFIDRDSGVFMCCADQECTTPNKNNTHILGQWIDYGTNLISSLFTGNASDSHADL